MTNSKTPSTSDITLALTARDRLSAWRQSAVAKHWRFSLGALCMAIAAVGVGLDLGIVNLWERQVQSLFFELRGPVAPPEDIVILAIDEESLAQGKSYQEDPVRYANLQLLESWPWRRQAYAQVIARLMEAGAKAVAVDVFFSTPSSYGPADDQALTDVLERYGERVVLAADYSSADLRQGSLSQPSLPLPQFRAAGIEVGAVNFHREIDGKIHRLGGTFLTDLAQAEAALFGSPLESEPPLSFAQATLKAADEEFSAGLQENVFFYGPSGSFQQRPFWYVLDDDPWQNQLGSGRFFKDKIVIIGTTADVHKDFHETPFAESLLYPEQMPGVEILANTVVTLREDLSPTQLIRRPPLNALIVLGVGLSVVGLMNCTPKPLHRLLIAGSGVGLWGLVGYGAFVGSQTILIAGTPMVAIAAVGAMDLGVSFTADRLKRKHLRTTLARYATSPLVQEIISQQDDLKDLLDLRQADMIGSLLGDRYRIVKILGVGGFGETYLARDTLRPGEPICVVKQLKIVSNDLKAHRLARRLFEAEAVVLEQLGAHDQIPRLLAYFEIRQSFYLVQEMVEGQLLRGLISRTRPLSQRAVVELLCDLLPVISFIHSQGVIHRDIKPSNIIRRDRDGHYVLIDFGAVKTIPDRLIDDDSPMTSTVGIGTQGYMPSEQSAGMPTVRSDLYALGITAIEALTGKSPQALRRSDDGEVIWSHKLGDISPALAKIINRMVRYDFNQRYPSAQSVLNDIKQLDYALLTDVSPTAVEQNSLEGSDNTYNQGTRPGVIDTNSALEKTQLLPTDWPEQMGQPHIPRQPPLE